jgi:hypothetical protein
MEQLRTCQGGEFEANHVVEHLRHNRITLRHLGNEALTQVGIPTQRSESPQVTHVVEVEPSATGEATFREIGQLALDLEWPQPPYPGEHEGQLTQEDALVTRRLMRTVAEVFDGRRPIAHLEQQLAPRVFAAMQTVAHSIMQSQQSVRLHSVHAYKPTEGAIEAAATIWRDRRAQALVARLEATKRGWQCTLLRLV